MARIDNHTENRTKIHECEHRYTFKKENLYTDVNVIFSKKICEKCGKEIVLSRKSKIRIILFAVFLCILFFLCETQLKTILPNVSYGAKGMVLVFLFCAALGIGLYQLMNRATYVTYQAPERKYHEAFEQARRENDERAREKYEQAMRKREEKRAQKAAKKRQ